jgi:hypothetical protein
MGQKFLGAKWQSITIVDLQMMMDVPIQVVSFLLALLAISSLSNMQAVALTQALQQQKSEPQAQGQLLPVLQLLLRGSYNDTNTHQNSSTNQTMDTTFLSIDDILIALILFKHLCGRIIPLLFCKFNLGKLSKEYRVFNS